jgi:opacity protein-like surface antigen
MRTIILMALGLSAASPAFAGGIGYLGLRGSYVHAEDEGATSTSIDANSNFADGWGVSGFIGFVIDEALRAELEAGYRTNDIERVTITRNTLMPLSVGTIIPVDGEASTATAMANLYYDFQIKGLPVLPWVGFGIGAAHTNYEVSYDYGDPLDLVIIKDSGWQFAYQLMAGVTVPVSEATSVSAGYRFFATGDTSYVATDGTKFDTGLTNHSFDLGLQFHL